MAQERLMDITAMELGELRAEMEVVNTKIDATPADAEGFPVQSPAFWALLDERSMIDDIIEVGAVVRPFSSPCAMVIEP